MQLLMVRYRSRAAVAAAACLVAAAFVACARPDDRGSDTVQPPSEDRGSPRLTKPVTDYTGDEFQTVVSALYFGGSAVDDVMTSDTGMGAPQPPGDAELMIEAMSEANRVDLNDVGNFGTVVARLRNLGGGSDPTFGTTPGASHEYYVVVTPGTSSDTAAFTIVRLTRGPNPAIQPRGRTGIIAPCAVDEPAPSYSSARFGGCVHRGDVAEAERTSFFGVRTLWAQGRGSAWVSCSAGCCELTMAQTGVQ